MYYTINSQYLHRHIFIALVNISGTTPKSTSESTTTVNLVPIGISNFHLEQDLDNH